MKLFNANKQNKKKFEESDLPSTRKKQFGDILVLRYRSLVFIGIMLAIFFLPILLIFPPTRLGTTAHRRFCRLWLVRRS